VALWKSSGGKLVYRRDRSRMTAIRVIVSVDGSDGVANSRMSAR
jgi:hypothetical protein